MQITIVLFLLFAVLQTSYAQKELKEDSLKTYKFKGVSVLGTRYIESSGILPSVNETFIIAGKKSEVLFIKDHPAILAEKTGRQLFSRIPGAFIYDMDGAGNQVNVATRGLDPHRSWELNVRHNGVITNSDMYGYPASHYSMPMESIEKIEMVRGTASLQYGQQFGGMINYVSKSADTTRQIAFESINSAGSFGMFSSFNAIGGKINNLTYYAYYQKRVSDGYRDDANSNAEAQFFNLNYDFADNFSIKAELGRSQYVYQIPGPLNDLMFASNPRQSSRERNFYSPNIYVPSLTFDWKISDNTKLNLILSGIYGDRNSVQFEGFADIDDVINTETNRYANRNTHIDNYNTRTAELRLLHNYSFLGLKNTVASGVRYFNNLLERRQRGIALNDLGYNLDVVNGFWGRDIDFHSQSIAFSVENLLYITDDFTISPGLRYELGDSKMSGFVSDIDDRDVPYTIDYNFVTWGINLEWKIDNNTRIFAGFSQANRPVLFKDIVPASTLEAINRDLNHSTGYNAEIGVDGYLFNSLTYNLTYFNMQYNDRVGGFVNNIDGQDLILRRNFGNSTSNGFELYIELDLIRNDNLYLSLFTASSYIDARYNSGAKIVDANRQNIDIGGNKVEAVPEIISRNGVNLQFSGFNFLLQYSYVGESFSDPLNTTLPPSSGAAGIVPAYGLLDLNMSYRLNENYSFRFGVNNITNKQYFTRRPLFYPGPGIWSSDGRGFVFSLQTNL